MLIIYEKHEMLEDFVDYLKVFADVYITSNVQDTLNYISTYPYSLFIIDTTDKTLELKCKLIRTIRKINNIPIMVLSSRQKREYIEAGADMVLSEFCKREEIVLNAYALSRRYICWKKEEREKI